MSAIDISKDEKSVAVRSSDELFAKLKEGGVEEFYIVEDGKGNLILITNERFVEDDYDKKDAFYKSVEGTEIASALYHSPSFTATAEEVKDKIKSVLEQKNVGSVSALPWLRRISKRLNINYGKKTAAAKKIAAKKIAAAKRAAAKKTRKSKASGTSRSKSRSTSRSKSPKKTKRQSGGEKKARQPRKAKAVNTDVTGFSLEELGLNNSAKIKSLFNKSLYEHEEPQLGNIGFGKKGAKEKRSGIWKVPKKIRRSELFGMNLPL